MADLTSWSPLALHQPDNVTESPPIPYIPSVHSESCFTAPTQACYDTWREVHFVAVGMILPVGFVFNSLALLVFATSWMRGTVPGRYFMALAVADNLVLTGEFLSWLNSFNSHGPRLGISFQHTAPWACRAVTWLRYGARIWSSWITVAITVERFLTVTYPLKMAAYSNPRKSTVVCVVLFFVSFTMSLFAFFLLRVGNYNQQSLCVYTDTIMYHTVTLAVLGTVGELLIPSSIVLCFTILIIKSLRKAQRRRELATRQSRLSHPRYKETQPTVALLAIAIMFIVIRLPYMVIFILQDVSHLFQGQTQSFSLYIAYKISQFLAVNNYAFNFVIFCVSGSAFRSQFMRFITCQCRRTKLASDFTRSRSLSVENANHFQVLVGKGRSASVDILCHIGRRITPINSKNASVERLQCPLLHPTARSASVGADRLLYCHTARTVGADKLLQCHRSDLKMNGLHPAMTNALRTSFKARSLTAEKLHMEGSIPYMDDMYG